ncbi:MAG: YjzD family protein [Lactobacillus sp.]|jgi:uncharacterized membrane protein YgaE (UPF0421/DUF939 family)|uniref:YjzD family protein n=1 Tax=Lacticaseibacillus suilingensis TaxID=2799577 RepID=A0ABW4BG78_9LACO|nr:MULTISPECIES: YjzD family protein [Lacticaseibacillus]MCI1893374.1 YjzD family protein [Lactobacillus sp.]MCI1918411.1 YjzD family protein [Lactobacillus sp.]MCI1940559.1 YjzD family protein [Lactobacillus sp.]MCI1971036.1 YjzD family protein [Lactobacillus sp.]MCI2037072.1 YjzD family protein [Lactobacillus sp.]
MRYVATLVWGVILGQVVGFLVSALSGGTYDPKMAGITSILFVIILFALPPIMKHFDSTATDKKAN